MIGGHHQMLANHETGGVPVRAPIQKGDHALQSVRIPLCKLEFQRDSVAFVLLNQFRRSLAQTPGREQTQNQPNKRQTAKLFFHPSLLARKPSAIKRKRGFITHDYFGRATVKELKRESSS